LTAIANTALLTCQSNRFIDNSTNNYALTASGTPKIQTLNPFQYNQGQSYYFNGSSYLTGQSQSLAFGTGDFTVEAWVYQPAVNTNNGILQISATAGGLQSSQTLTLALAWNSTGWTIYAANSNPYTASSVIAGQWYHIAYVRQSGLAKFYVNGVSMSGNILNSASGFVDSTNYTGTYLCVGGYYSTTYLSNQYVADLRITKYARYTSNNTTYLTSGPYLNR
jgi:hypothetical protein